ncbi:M23 family metallopeptidase [Microbacterium halophytorum]|uniref:M23 family metallopeptidase n=1 Tax=Microbacterium halophytorum TaxID=2067568 RepID=UPI000CFDD2C2|nr:M23 family metallopeptidase [Microbacterium halophytorum]
MTHTDSTARTPEAADTAPKSSGTAPITRRELRRAEREFAAGARRADKADKKAHPHARPVRSLATVGAVVALLAGVAIPAYAVTTTSVDETASPSAHQLAEENAQSLSVGDDVKAADLEVAKYSATTPKEIEKEKAKEAAAKRAKEAEAAAAAASSSGYKPANISAEEPVVSGGFANPLGSSSYSLGTPGVHGFGVYRPNSGTIHMGQDMMAPSGTPIVAAIDGTVDSAGWSGGYGNLVQLSGTVDGSQTTIKNGHMSAVAVSAGQAVQKGDVIGYVGSTGFSDVNHLHVEVWINGTAYDPRSYLPIG